jgi:hypothetical protein
LQRQHDDPGPRIIRKNSSVRHPAFFYGSHHALNGFLMPALKT